MNKKLKDTVKQSKQTLKTWWMLGHKTSIWLASLIRNGDESNQLIA